MQDFLCDAEMRTFSGLRDPKSPPQKKPAPTTNPSLLMGWETKRRAECHDSLLICRVQPRPAAKRPVFSLLTTEDDRDQKQPNWAEQKKQMYL